MREPEGVYKLCIHDPQKIDGGRFICEASNSAGKEEIRRTIRFLGKEHYKYLPGIRHADPKAPHEKEADDGLPALPVEEPAPPAPESDEPEMVRAFKIIQKFKIYFIFHFPGQMGKHQAQKRKETSLA